MMQMLMQQQTDVQLEPKQQQQQVLHPIKTQQPNQQCICTKITGLIFISISLFLLLSWQILNFSPTSHIIIISWDKEAKGQPYNMQNILSQAYQNWEIFYFRSTTQQINEEINDIRILTSSGNKGQDIYNVITHYSEQQSIILLLNEYQTLTSVYELGKIVYAFDNKSINLGFINFNLSDSTKQIYNEDFDFHRDLLVPLNSTNLSQKFKIQGQKILNHLRVFRSSCYKSIFYFDLMDAKEQFYQSDLSFLLPILEMQNKTTNIFHFDWPVFLTTYWHNLTQSKQILEIGLKTIYTPAIENKFKFYPTKQFNVLQRKQIVQKIDKNSQKVIPKKLHHIKLQDFSIQQLQSSNILNNQIFKQYQQIIWKKQNITIQNFPQTYAFLTKTLSNKNQIKYNEVKTVMMWEILYRYGGIYINLQYSLLTLPEQIQFFPFSLILDSTLNNQVTNKIMASKPQNLYLKRLLNNSLLNEFVDEKPSIFSTQYLLSKMTQEQFYMQFKIYPAWKFFPRIENSVDVRRSEFSCISDICTNLGWNYGFLNQKTEIDQSQPKQQEQVTQVSKRNFYVQDISEPSDLQFCIVSVKSSTVENFLASALLLKKQIYQNWKAYFYVSNQDELNQRKQALEQNNLIYIEILISSSNQGRDIYDAIINKCSYNSITVLLNQGEILYTQDTLSAFKQKFEDDKIYMVASSFYLKGKIVLPTTQLWKFRRDYFFKGNVRQLEKVRYITQNMLQTIRVFRSEMYRRIQYLDLMYENQTFYSQKVSFLYPLIQFRCKGHCKIYNDQENIFLPESFLILDLKIPLYKTQQQEFIQNQQQFTQIGAKMLYQPLQQILDFAEKKHAHGNPPSHNPLMWGTKLNILQRNISNTQKIPRIVHQIWIGKQIPSYKKKFMNRVKSILQADGFEYKLWGNQNITKQNFPYTYNYIQKLFEIDKTSNYTRLAMIVDLMKVETVYHFGGFYIDTNYQLFKTLVPLLKYPFVGMMELPGFLGQYLATSFFGAQKDSKFLKRLFQPIILQSINLKQGPKSNLQTGPAFLGRAFYPQDYYFQIKVMPAQKIYPYIYWGRDIRFTQSKCSFPIYQSIPPNLKEKYDQVIETRQYKILHPCRLYPDAYGMDHWNLGGSWKNPKTF